MSGIDLPDGRGIRKGAPNTVARYVERPGRHDPRRLPGRPSTRSPPGAPRRWPSPRTTGIVGVVKLEDILKPGIRERFERLRQMGLRVVMVTGDNPLTAKAIAEQAGVDDFIAQATPEAKLAYIRKEQDGGKLVAMMGDGTNDAPALAQADIGVAMNSRHPGRQGGRQHGRPRQRPDQAHRGRRDRQATPDDPRRADDVLDRQRPGQVLRRRSRPCSSSRCPS